MDLRILELAGLYSKRTFLEVNDHGRDVKASLPGFDQSFVVEMARFFATAKQHFGRLGVGFFRFPDAKFQGARISLSSGTQPTEAMPWELKLRVALFLPFQGNDKHYNFEMLCAREWGSLKLGGVASVSYRPRDINVVGVYEYMLISFGPYADFALGPSRINLSARWRTWLDKDVFLRSGQLTVANPNEMVVLPDLKLQWSFLF